MATCFLSLGWYCEEVRTRGEQQASQVQEHNDPWLCNDSCAIKDFCWPLVASRSSLHFRREEGPSEQSDQCECGFYHKCILLEEEVDKQIWKVVGANAFLVGTSIFWKLLNQLTGIAAQVTIFYLLYICFYIIFICFDTSKNLILWFDSKVPGDGESAIELIDFNMGLSRVIKTMATNVFWVLKDSLQWAWH